MTGALAITGVWDIETKNWDTFLCGQTLDIHGNAFVSWDEEEFFEHLLSRRGVWYAHVGGRFDALWFLDHCCRQAIKWSARMRGSGILSAKAEELELRDSFAIVPMKLSKFAPLGGIEKCELHLPCECDERSTDNPAGCGGYCALARPLSSAERRNVTDYLHVDCEALLSALLALEARCEADGIELRLTVGSSAWNTAKTWLDLPDCGHDLGKYRDIREGYFGGRTEVYCTRGDSGHRFDIHSSYPAALSRLAIPVGRGKAYIGSHTRALYDAGKDGIVWADVHIPESYVPPLPVRMPDRLLYPTGPASGAWTAHELRYAESCGVRIERITRGYMWASSAPILAPFANRVWALRDKYAATGNKADKVYSDWCKWLANSCTGKFASKPENSSLEYHPAAIDDSDPDAAPILSTDSEVVCTHGGVFVTKTRARVDPCAHVQWSAYLTAEARIELHKQQRSSACLYYSDTDSVYSRDMLTRRIGPDLGEWGYEGGLTEWSALAPKVYRYRCTGLPHCKEKGHAQGGYHVRGKGMSGLDSDGFDALESGKVWTTEKGVKGLKTAVRGKGPIFEKRKLSRGLHPIPGWVGGRELEADGINTRPTTVKRYQERDTK